MSDTNALVPIADIMKMAQYAANSKLFGVKTESEAAALMLVAQAEGMHPMAAVQEFHIIQGRPSRKAEAMLARFQRAGGSVKWSDYTDKRVAGTFSHPQGGSVEVIWTMERAKIVGLADKDNWKKYPAAMMRSRCVSEGVRTVYPGATGGMYTPDEIEELAPKEMGNVEVVPVSTPKAKSESKPTSDAVDAEIIAQESATAPTVAESPEAAKPITEGAVRLLLAKLESAALSDADLCKHFGIEKLTSLKVGQMNDALKWVKNPS